MSAQEIIDQIKSLPPAERAAVTKFVVEHDGKTVPSKESTPSQLTDDVFRMGDHAMETGIPDLATNADHYLYGHPKVTHGG
jgi:hypothetical protein